MKKRAQMSGTRWPSNELDALPTQPPSSISNISSMVGKGPRFSASSILRLSSSTGSRSTFSKIVAFGWSYTEKLSSAKSSLKVTPRKAGRFLKVLMSLKPSFSPHSSLRKATVAGYSSGMRGNESAMRGVPKTM